MFYVIISNILAMMVLMIMTHTHIMTYDDMVYTYVQWIELLYTYNVNSHINYKSLLWHISLAIDASVLCVSAYVPASKGLFMYVYLFT